MKSPMERGDAPHAAPLDPDTTKHRESTADVSMTTALAAEKVFDLAVYDNVPRLEWGDHIVFDPKASEELVEDVLQVGGSSMVYGETNSGKTTLALDLAMRLPSNRPWLGKRTRRGGSLYVAAESPESIRRRIEAYRRTHDHKLHVFAMLAAPTLNVLDPLAVERLIDITLAGFNNLSLPPDLIVIDTLSRVTAGANENASEDMSRLVAAGDLLRKETGAHVAWVHHSGKDAAKGARGHSILRAAVDTEIEVTAADGLHRLEVTKQRDLGTKGVILTSRFRPVELGRNQWGKPITACVVETVDEASAHLQAVMQGVDNERAESVVLKGFRSLVAMGIEPTDGPTTHRFLPRQLVDKGLAEGFDRATLSAALNRLMRDGQLRVDVVGKYGNRGAKKGLVETA